MSKTIKLPNGKRWSTQTEALAYFKAMLHRYADNETVEDRSDHDDLIALLERYDGAIAEGPSKIGPGIDHFFRRRNIGATFSTPSFWVRQVDGTETDFSYPHAVRGEPKSKQQEFYDACRDAVAAELLAAKKAHFTQYADSEGRVRCELTDELITFEEAHLDHAYPTFGQLVVTFRAANGWQHDLPAWILTVPDNAQTTTRFTDPTTAERFRAFHRGAAMLRVISRTQNLAMAGRQRRPTIRRLSSCSSTRAGVRMHITNGRPRKSGSAAAGIKYHGIVGASHDLREPAQSGLPAASTCVLTSPRFGGRRRDENRRARRFDPVVAAARVEVVVRRGVYGRYRESRTNKLAAIYRSGSARLYIAADLFLDPPFGGTIASR